MCTPHRWRGNNAGRYKLKEEDSRKRSDRQLKRVLKSEV